MLQCTNYFQKDWKVENETLAKRNADLHQDLRHEKRVEKSEF
jgi:hypothetical protein